MQYEITKSDKSEYLSEYEGQRRIKLSKEREI